MCVFLLIFICLKSERMFTQIFQDSPGNSGHEDSFLVKKISVQLHHQILCIIFQIRCIMLLFVLLAAVFSIVSGNCREGLHPWYRNCKFSATLCPSLDCSKRQALESHCETCYSEDEDVMRKLYCK